MKLDLAFIECECGFEGLHETNEADSEEVIYCPDCGDPNYVVCLDWDIELEKYRGRKIMLEHPAPIPVDTQHEMVHLGSALFFAVVYGLKIHVLCGWLDRSLRRMLP